MMKLGQKVKITGRLEKIYATRASVQDQITKILKKGSTGISRKYETYYFDEIRTGFIAGRRSVVGQREHFRSVNPLTGEYFVDTMTIRQTAYVVACDMRGLILVPENCIQESFENEISDEDLDFEFDDDFEEDELFDLDKELI